VKKSTFIKFLSVVLTVYFLLNYYIFITGWFAIPDSYRIAYLVLYIFISLSFIAGRFLERAMQNSFTTFLVWVGSIWLGAFVYLLFIILLLDISRLINHFIPFFPKSIYADYGKTKLLSFFAINIVVAIIVLAGYLNAMYPRIRKLRFEVDKTCGKFRQLKIAAATDIHLGTIIGKSRIERIVKMINSLDADIVLLPGDVVDEDIGPVIKRNLGETLRKIESKYGVYAVTGNHEYIGGAEAACKYLTEHGIKFLRDDFVLIEDCIYIAGREDRAMKSFTGKIRKPLEEILTGVDMSKPVILMDHQPIGLHDAKQHGIDVQLSGHTHHGQLWPFNYITQRIFEKSWGYTRKGETQFYISCGAGTWGPPIRTGHRPEILDITLVFLT